MWKRKKFKKYKEIHNFVFLEDVFLKLLKRSFYVKSGAPSVGDIWTRRASCTGRGGAPVYMYIHVTVPAPAPGASIIDPN